MAACLLRGHRPRVLSVSARVALEKTGQFLETMDEGVGKLGVEDEDAAGEGTGFLFPRRSPRAEEAERVLKGHGGNEAGR